jgi:hypothetical protein
MTPQYFEKLHKKMIVNFLHIIYYSLSTIHYFRMDSLDICPLSLYR